MTELTTPAFLQDIDTRLGAEGFQCDHTWYHGTSSGLAGHIQQQGLHGAGDAELLSRTQGTLNTIGAPALTSQDPVFLTPSKTLAYYWADQKARSRNLYFANNETPVVFQVNLTAEQNQQVHTDAGGTALLLEPGNAYIHFLQNLYSEHGYEWPEMDPLKTDRMSFLTRLGLAYSNVSIAADSLELLGE